jgi:hypothetical protein
MDDRPATIDPYEVKARKVYRKRAGKPQHGHGFGIDYR